MTGTRAIALACAVTLGLAGAPHALPGAQTYDNLAARYAAATHAAQADANTTTARYGAPIAAARPAALSPVDLRVALLSTARPEMAEEQALLAAAQGRRGLTGLRIEAGIIDLPALVAGLRATDPDLWGDAGLRIPLVVGPAATLRIGDGAALRLDRAAGAFLLVQGRLEVTGGAVLGAGAANPHAATFAPFILATGGGGIVARGARFADLGFGWRPVFGGVAVVANALFDTRGVATFEAATFHGIASLLISGVRDARVHDSRFVDTKRSALILEQTRGARIDGSVFLRGQTGDAIRLQKGATDTTIAQTQIYRPRENAIALMPGSQDTRITDARIWQPRHHGIRARGSACVSIRGAIVAQARFDAVSLSAAHGAALADSVLTGARHAGLRVDDLPEQALTQVTGTVFDGNRIGVDTAAPGTVALSGNDFRTQFPRFLSGDIAPMTPLLLADLTNATPLALRAGGRSAEVRPAQPCKTRKDP